MTRTRLCFAGALFHAGLAVATPALGAGPEAALARETAPPVTIPRSQSHELHDPATGETYRLLLWRPSTPPPPEGYPAVYLLDANSSFGTVTEIIEARSRRAEATGMAPAVVVGIDYPEGDGRQALKRRIHDLTPPAERVSLPPRPNGVPWPETGGANAFLRFIEEEVKPFVGGIHPVDRSRETLMGHSFGGLFTLHVLFTKPETFGTYVANSPSIWFNGRQVLEEARAFKRRRSAAEGPPRRLMLSVSAMEQTLTKAEAARPDADRRRAWKAGNRMVDNSRDLAALLEDAPRLTLQSDVLPGEDHISGLPIQISRGLAFALATARAD